jgi:DNA-binding NtrC family response regulator
VEDLAPRVRDRALAALLVDGSIGTRAPLAASLRGAGCQVFEAATSDEALALLNARLEIDAVVVQQALGGSMGGEAFADWVRRTRPALRVIVLRDGQDFRALLAMLAPAKTAP